jgi:hypothetical protein
MKLLDKVRKPARVFSTWMASPQAMTTIQLGVAVFTLFKAIDAYRNSHKRIGFKRD